MKNQATIAIASTLVFGASLFTTLSNAKANNYAQESPGTIDDIVHETVLDNDDLDTDRTTVGIGEEVILKIDKDSWSDKDCNTTTNMVEDDELGAIVWSVEKPEGSSAELQNVAEGENIDEDRWSAKHMLCGHTPGQVKAIAIITDSGTKYDDYEDENGQEQDQLRKTETFTVIAPNGQTTEYKDGGAPIWTEDEDGDYLGVTSRFTATLQPTTVIFQYANIVEVYEETTWEWPDGTDAVWEVKQGKDPNGENYDQGLNVSLVLDENNEWIDNRNLNNDLEDDDDPLTSNRITRDHLNGLAMGNVFTVPIIINMEWKNDAGEWTEFLDGNQSKYEFRRDNNAAKDYQGRHTMKGTGGNAVTSWQGPWEAE